MTRHLNGLTGNMKDIWDKSCIVFIKEYKMNILTDFVTLEKINKIQ